MNLKNQRTEALRHMIKALSTLTSQWLNTPEDEKRLEQAKLELKRRGKT